MARPKGSRNQATVDREAAERIAGVPMGEPDQAALSAIEAANRAPAEAEVVDAEEPAPIETIEPTPAVQDDFKAQLRAAFKDPSIAMAAIESVSTTPEGRALLNLQPGQGLASGEQRVDYHRKDNQVMGGVEVEHPPTFQRLPPSQIAPYVDADGKPTHYPDPFIQPKVVSVPMKGEDGEFVVDEQGRQIWREETQMVLIDKGAAKDDQGRPVKSEEYKRWLDATHNGGRFDDDPAAASTAPAPQQTTSGAPAIVMADGAPVTTSAVGMDF